MTNYQRINMPYIKRPELQDLLHAAAKLHELAQNEGSEVLSRVATWLEQHGMESEDRAQARLEGCGLAYYRKHIKGKK